MLLLFKEQVEGVEQRIILIMLLVLEVQEGAVKVVVMLVVNRHL
jgi:hypothetical protein